MLCSEFEETGQVHGISKVVLVMEGSVSEGKFEVDSLCESLWGQWHVVMGGGQQTIIRFLCALMFLEF